MLAGMGFETICGPQGSGRSGRLAERLRRVVCPDGPPCIVLDPTGHWSGSRTDLLPPGTTVLRADAILARGGDALSVLSIMALKVPGTLIAIDDAEHVVADRRSWSSLMAAVAAGRGRLIVVAPSHSEAVPHGYAPISSHRAAALACFA